MLSTGTGCLDRSCNVSKQWHCGHCDTMDSWTSSLMQKSDNGKWQKKTNAVLCSKWFSFKILIVLLLVVMFSWQETKKKCLNKSTNGLYRGYCDECVSEWVKDYCIFLNFFLCYFYAYYRNRNSMQTVQLKKLNASSIISQTLWHELHHRKTKRNSLLVLRFEETWNVGLDSSLWVVECRCPLLAGKCKVKLMSRAKLVVHVCIVSVPERYCQSVIFKLLPARLTVKRISACGMD